MIHCHRCGEPVAERAEFCAHCGAPQLYMTVEEDAAEGETGDAAAAPPARAGMVEWDVALGFAAMVAAIGLALFIGAEWLPALSVLSFVLVLSAGQLVVDLYRRRRPLARMDGAVGARIGAATGVLLGAAKAIAVSVTGVVERYGMHHGAQMDAEYTQAITSARQSVEKMTSGPLPAWQVHLMHSQGYHVMLVLAGVAIAAALILAVTTAAGAFVGFIHGKRRMAA